MLSADTVCQAVLDEVRNVEVIDVHTHLLHFAFNLELALC